MALIPAVLILFQSVPVLRAYNIDTMVFWNHDGD